MADDGTRWSHTSGEAEELNVRIVSIEEIKHLVKLSPLTASQKLTTNYEIVRSSGDNTKKDREERKKKREQRENEEQKAKEKEAKEKAAKGKGQGK